MQAGFQERAIKFFQVFGKSMLTPISILAAIGIIVGLTSALNRPQVAELLPFMGNDFIAYVLLTIRAVSLELFALIPVLFSISIAFGLAKKEKHIAALAGFLGYYVLMYSSGIMVKSEWAHYPTKDLATVFGILTVNMGALGGILSGLAASAIHNRFYNLKLPSAIAFFGGTRSVSIITFLVMMVVGQLVPFIWLPITIGMNALGHAITGLSLFGTFLYGFLEKLLLPTGLHHVVINLFRTTALGGSLVLDGVQIDGALNIVSSLMGNVPTQDLAPYTRFMGQGRVPIHIFGLPAAAWAMYKITKPERRHIVKPLLIAGTLSVFTTGITEPIEFLFLFTAPLLYIFHSVMTGIGFLLMDLFHVVISNTQGGIIDVLVFGMLVEDSRWYMILPVGVVYAVLYFMVFKWYLTKKGIIIAEGSEGEMDVFGDKEGDKENNKDSSPVAKGNNQAMQVINALGGQENIVNLYNCITRLRVDVKDMSKVNEPQLKATKALGIVKVSDTHVQVIYGPKVEEIALEVKAVLGIE